jgi:AraC-like DNA-binding protein
MRNLENNHDELKTFNLYKYLKEQNSHSMSFPYFLANQDTYKDVSVRFPFRTFTYGIGITYSGEPNLFKIGSADFEVKTGCLTTIGPGIVSQWMGNYSGEHDTIYFTDNIFGDLLNVSYLNSLPFFLPGGMHVIQLQSAEVEKIKLLFNLLKSFKEDKRLMPGLTHSLLTLVTDIHNSISNKSNAQLNNKESVAGKFRGLVAKHFPEQKDVAFYASSLNITPKYLSEILIEVLGKSAKILIDEHIAMEAKSLLRQTNMSIQEICYWLGYEDTSYFTKVFKKWEGISPLTYRQL